MSFDPAWRTLVEQLVDEGRESPYLERLRRSYDVRMPRESIEREVLREMANALSRAEDKVNFALLELELAAERCERSGDRASVEVFNEKRTKALKARRDLLIHRDALHFTRDPRFERRYPVPPAKKIPS